MADSKADVNIDMPIYYRERCSPQVLDSLLAQDYGNLGVAILDNASTDGTEGIYHEYAMRDDRIGYHRNWLGLSTRASSAQTSPTGWGVV
jgi:glycosyltransferase involved in cell wall biosynthesis